MMSGPEVQGKIVELVQGFWDANQRPLLMSSLGLHLRREISPEKLQNEFLGGKLKAYIDHNLGHLVRTVPSQPGSAIWAAIPASVPISAGEVDQKLSSAKITASKNENRSIPYVRYDRALWQAFTTPILTSEDRYILPGARIGTAEISKGGAAPEGAIIVEPTDIEHPDAGYIAIAEKIETWATRNKIDLTNHKRTSIAQSKKTALDILLETLSEDDLRNTSMSLNSIKALMLKKI